MVLKTNTSKYVIFKTIGISLLLLGLIINIAYINSSLNQLNSSMEEIKPVASCDKWGMQGKRSAVIYNRFDNEIRIECEKNKKS